VTHAIMHREIWLFGELTTEVWFNSGASDFTFQPHARRVHRAWLRGRAQRREDRPGAVLAGPRSAGQGVVFAGRNYTAERISTPALETEIFDVRASTTPSDFSYLQAGHAFYVLTFPTASKTWCVRCDVTAMGRARVSWKPTAAWRGTA
jgi:hypothetical protein